MYWSKSIPLTISYALHLSSSFLREKLSIDNYDVRLCKDGLCPLPMYQMSKRIYGRVGDKIRNSFLIKACFLA